MLLAVRSSFVRYLLARVCVHVLPVWRGLVDDAAIFPPGDAPIDEAVARARRAPRRAVRRPGRHVRRPGHRHPAAARDPARRWRSWSPAAPVRSPARPDSCRKLALELAGLEIALRDLDDLAGNARRVAAAVDAARAEGALDDDVRSTSSCPRATL